MIYGSRVVEERNIPFMKNEAGLADLIEILPYEELDKGIVMVAVAHADQWSSEGSVCN